MKELGAIIQLANRIFAYPYEIIENVLIQVDRLIFPANFYVIYMDDRNAPIPTPIILGRLFLGTTQTKIDVSKGILTMEFNGELVHFNIFDIMKYLVNSYSMFVIHAIDPFV